MVLKKKNEKWRVCVDFIDLNKACLKDPFLIPRIDHLVVSTVGHHRMRFLDAFQGYFCNIHWELSLQGDAFWIEECRVYLPEAKHVMLGLVPLNPII